MEAKNKFEKDFFKLMNNSVFGKTMENVRNHRDIKLVTTDARRIELVSEPNYHTTKHFAEEFLAIEMRRSKVKKNKPVYLGQSILDISKTLMYEFWYDYIKPKYGDKAKLCYMDTDSFFINIETEYFYKDIANDVNKCFDTSGYDKNDKRLLPIGKNKVIGMFKDEINEKVMVELCAPRAETYAFRLDDDTEKKRAKGIRKCLIKRVLIFQDYQEAVIKNKTIIRSQLRSKNDEHTIHTEKVNIVAISSDDDKILQTYDEVTTYPYGANAFKVWEGDMLVKIKRYIDYEVLLTKTNTSDKY